MIFTYADKSPILTQPLRAFSLGPSRIMPQIVGQMRVAIIPPNTAAISTAKRLWRPSPITTRILPFFCTYLGRRFIHHMTSPLVGTKMRTALCTTGCFTGVRHICACNLPFYGPNLTAPDANKVNFTRLAIKNCEHTWGRDVKSNLHEFRCK